MTAEELLTTLEARTPLVTLQPVTPVPTIYPTTPTMVLARYRKLGIHYLQQDVAELPDERLWLPPWGWCDVVTPKIADTHGDMGETFVGTQSVAFTIAKVDDRVCPIKLRDQWYLAHDIRQSLTPLVVTCAFWLRTRHHAFLQVLEEIDQKQQADQRRPVLLVGSLLAGPDQILH